MVILDELKEFIKTILQAIYLLLVTSIVLFSFGLKKVIVLGSQFTLPMPTENSFTVQFFKRIQHDLLPPGVQLVVTNPLSAFVSQMHLSILLALILTFPFFIYRIMNYISPALFRHEKKAIIQSLLPSSILFFSGCLFSYFYIIPLTFKVLYPYATAIGATMFFSVDEFISTVLSLMIATGIMFLLPLFMMLLSFLGVIQPSFWRSKWRHSMLVFLVFSAIITVDGTGITMLMLFFPMLGLYFIGCFLTSRFDRGKITEKVLT